MLFLIASPIGNLSDFSYRAIETIQECDYLLCEDTRRSGILLKHYGLKKPMKSFYRYNESAKEERVLADLKAGQKIGVLSDAGVPGISDPGEKLVKQCHAIGITVVSIPGACALISALVSSGLDTSRFQFLGFLPIKKGKVKKILQESLLYPGTTVFYESPFRLVSTLRIINEIQPDWICAVARELTKKFESVKKSRVGDLLNHYETHPPKGEIVLLVEGQDPKSIKKNKSKLF